MKRQEKGRGKLDIRVLFTLAAIAEILGTLLIATLLTALLENLLHETIEVHPLVWLLLFGTTIGLTAATVVNVLLLRPVVRLSRAMKQVASGNFAVRLTTNSVINEIADSYDSFNRMVEALGETETLQTDFVSNVSHEIKTPVSAIEGYTTLLQSTDVSPEQAGYIERILLNTRRLSTLVGNILLLSKVSNHAMPMKRTCYRLDEQIRQAIVLLEAQWSPKQLDFDADLAEVTWRGPETLMLHVWTNLISNAVKFSPQRGLIAVALKQTDGRFVNPPEQPKQPNQRKRIAVICAAVVIIVAAVVGIVLPMLPKAQAQIELSYPPENAYMMKEDGGFVGWQIHFYSTNVSDVPFTPTYAQAKWYLGDKLSGSSPAVDYNYMRNWMESDALVKGETPLDLYYGTDRQNVDRGVFIISGTDANGHELKFSISIDLIHEFPPESEN